jgi:hypothetical protein
MTEQEWLECTDPKPMLEFLRGKTTDRKLRLFAVACCRRVWHLLHKRGRRAITITEHFVDGMATPSALEQARARLSHNTYWDDGVRHAAAANSVDANLCWGWVVEARLTEDEEQDPLTVQIDLARLLFDVVGNPFRPVSILPTWLTPTVLKLAQAAYDNRLLPSGLLDNAGLAVLADALEEAGCADADNLSHLREPKDHVRGCWAVDLVLGKS